LSGLHKEITMSANSDKIKGRLKQAAGDLTGDPDLRRDGKVDEVAGRSKGWIDRLKSMVQRRR
jgi:uncharacterized protein YjbJ (UPF0337 family)